MSGRDLEDIVSRKGDNTSADNLFDNLVTNASGLKHTFTEHWVALLNKWQVLSGVSHLCVFHASYNQVIVSYLGTCLTPS